MTGKFIVVDGGNGAGKSTVLAHIKKMLEESGEQFVMTREPGGTPISEKIRGIILDPSTPEIHPITELLLFAAARAQHVEQLIKPSLEAGKVVISDRFDSATIAFQHYGRGIPMDTIQASIDLALNGFKPDMSIILDIDVATGAARTGSRGKVDDRFETEENQFLERARQGYLAQAAQDPDRFKVIDASRSLEDVISEVSEVIKQVIGQSKKKSINP